MTMHYETEYALAVAEELADYVRGHGVFASLYASDGTGERRTSRGLAFVRFNDAGKGRPFPIVTLARRTLARPDEAWRLSVPIVEDDPSQGYRDADRIPPGARFAWLRALAPAIPFGDARIVGVTVLIAPNHAIVMASPKRD